jgi:hypothetical protein
MAFDFSRPAELGPYDFNKFKYADGVSTVAFQASGTSVGAPHFEHDYL